MPESLGNKATKGTIWSSVDRLSVIVLQFVVNLILARLLMPDDFGAIGLITIFIAVAQTLIDGGFGAALIQKKNPTQEDYSTILWWNMAFSSFLYFLLFISAPLIADFYHIEGLTYIIRGIGLILILNAIVSIQINRLRKQLYFNKIAFINIFACIIGSGTAILAAYFQYGVWSLVILQLVTSMVSLIMLWFVTRWHPSIIFSTASFKTLFSFGGYLLAANLLQTICQNLQGLIIGRKFSATQMGYYSQAQKLDQLSSYALPQIIVQVMYPVFSQIQDDQKRLQDVVLRSIQIISFIIFPIITLLIIIAESLIETLYGTKWLPAVPYFQILCVGGLFSCLQNVNFYAIAAVGKSRELFYWSFYKWGFLLTALIVGMNFGMYGILWGMVLSSINIYLTNSWLTSKHIKLKFIKSILVLLPVLVIAAICGICTEFIILNFRLHFIITSLIFFVLYLSISAMSGLKALNDVLILLKRLLLK